MRNGSHTYVVFLTVPNALQALSIIAILSVIYLYSTLEGRTNNIANASFSILAIRLMQPPTPASTLTPLRMTVGQ